MEQIPKGSVGVNFDLTFRDETGAEVDTTAASARTLYFRKPSGAILTKNAVQVSGGKIRYIAIAGDLDELGLWRWSGKVILAGEAKPTLMNSFEVVDTLG